MYIAVFFLTWTFPSLVMFIKGSDVIDALKLFFMPLLIMAIFGSYQNNFLDFTWLVCASLFVFYLFVKPLRRRLPIPILLMFKCIDRPQVRPASLRPSLLTLAPPWKPRALPFL